MKVLILALLLATTGACYAQTKFIFGDHVSEGERKFIAKNVQLAMSKIQRKYGFKFVDGTTVFAGRDTDFLARQHVAFKGGGSVKRKKNELDSWIAGEAGYRFMLLNLSHPAFKSRENLAFGIFHETFHVFQWELIGKKGAKCCNHKKITVEGPVWLLEGSAVYFERTRKSGALNWTLNHGKSNRSILGPRGLAEFETFSGILPKQEKGYPVAAYAVSRLVQQSGEQSIAHFYAALRKTRNWKRAFESAFGLTIKEFYAKF